MVRNNQNVEVRQEDLNVAEEYKKKGQVLFNVKKVRNHYLIEPAELAKLKTLTPEAKKEFMAKDVDQCYAESGEQLLDPVDTYEKIYLIVRNISNRNEKQ